MNRRIILILSICCFFSVITVAQKPQARQKPADKSGAIDPRAMTALNRMNDYLKTLKAFRINTEVSKDELVDTNMKVQKSASNEISVRLPDRLHAHMSGDEQDLQVIYRPKSLSPPANKTFPFVSRVAAESHPFESSMELQSPLMEPVTLNVPVAGL